MLADRDKRSLYDRFGHAGVSGAAGAGGFDPTVFADFGDIFGSLGDIFGFGDMFGGGRRRGGPQRGADLRYDLEISFEESAHGTETAIQIPRQETCETCNGSGAAPGTLAGHLHAVPRAGPGPLPAGLLHRRAHVPARAAAPARSSPSRARRAAAPAASRASARSR